MHMGKAFSVRIDPGVECLGYGAHLQFFWASPQFPLLPAVSGSTYCSTSLTVLDIVRLFHFNHSVSVGCAVLVWFQFVFPLMSIWISSFMKCQVKFLFNFALVCLWLIWFVTTHLVTCPLTLQMDLRYVRCSVLITKTDDKTMMHSFCYYQIG